jgi:hypothetical protein
MSQSQIAQAKFYKNLTNKKQGPLANSLKKDSNGQATIALQQLATQANKDPSGASLNTSLVPPHERKLIFPH